MPRLPPPPRSTATPDKPKQSPLRRWMREIAITGAVLLCVMLILAWGLTEETQAMILGGIALVGAIYVTAVPVAEETKSRRVAAGLYAFSALWLLAAGFPFFKFIHPGAPLKHASLASEGAEEKLGKLDAGNYLVEASMPRSAVISDAKYSLTLRNAGQDQDLSGEFTRATFRTRAGRKGRGVSESIHSSDYHDVHLKPGETSIKLESFEHAGGGVEIAVFGNAAPYHLWLGIQITVVLIAAVLDALFSERKRRSTLTVGATFTLLFNIVARYGSPGRMFKSLIGAGIVGLIGGLLLGYLINALARLAAGVVRKRLA